MKLCQNVEKTAAIHVVYFKKYKTLDSENIAVSVSIYTVQSIRNSYIYLIYNQTIFISDPLLGRKNRLLRIVTKA